MKSQEPPNPGRGQRSTEDNGNSNSPQQVDSLVFIHNLVEQCLQRYMSRDDTVRMIARDVRVDPGAVTAVWQQLEKDNPEFFKSYYLMLKLIEQIKTFNDLLKQQQIATFESLPNHLEHTPSNINSSMGYPAQQLPYAPSVGPTTIQPLNNQLYYTVQVRVPEDFYYSPIRGHIDACPGFEEESVESCPAAEPDGDLVEFSFPVDDIQMAVDNSFDANRPAYLTPNYFDGVGQSTFPPFGAATAAATSSLLCDIDEVLKNYQQPNCLDPIDTATANLHAASEESDTGDKCIAGTPDTGSQRPSDEGKSSLLEEGAGENFPQPVPPLSATRNFLDQLSARPPSDTATANLHASSYECDTGDVSMADAPDTGSHGPNDAGKPTL